MATARKNNHPRAAITFPMRARILERRRRSPLPESTLPSVLLLSSDRELRREGRNFKVVLGMVKIKHSKMP